MSELNFMEIPLKDVIPSPTNPRKSFDVIKTTELADSIREKGVLQPILVRQKGKKYEIVCGERRFRASQMVLTQDKTKNTIPAVIRELNDQEVREMQLIENFQREDVHPMEEAVAIKYALESGQYSFEDLAHKVGKSLKYLRGRLKLAELSEGWQKVFYENKISITTAIKVSCFPKDVQDMILDDVNTDIDVEEDGLITLSDWELRSYQGILKEAPFEINDPELNVTMGPCTTCPNNTSFHNLFPDEQDGARCTNIQCFNSKSETAFSIRLNEAKEDPAIVMVSTEYNSFNDPRLIKKLQDEGYVVLKRYYDWETADEPVKPDLENDYDVEDYDSQADMIKDYEADMENYHNEKNIFDTAISSGKHLKAFVVDGDGKGTYRHIILKKKGEQKQSKEAVESGHAESPDFDAEILRLKEKEKRAKQIDQNKIWEVLKQQFDPGANASVLKGEFTPLERKAIAASLFNKLEYSDREDFKGLFNYDLRKKEYPEVDEISFRQMLRFYMLSVLPPQVLTDGYENHKEASLCMQIGRSYFSGLVEDAISAQTEKASKRGEKVDKAIKELQVKKKQLSSENAPKKRRGKDAAANDDTHDEE